MSATYLELLPGVPPLAHDASEPSSHSRSVLERIFASACDVSRSYASELVVLNY